MTSTGKIGNAFKLMKVAGAYWRGDSEQPDADAHLRHRLRQAGGARRLSAHAGGGREARPPPLGREMDLFHFQEEGPGVVFWHPKGWTMFQNLIAYMRRRLPARL
jgi:threonyl-tRNA synthetase